jgi:hypothetical protein
MAAVFLASFNPKIRPDVLGMAPRTHVVARTVECILMFSAMSAIGFSYMLWRYHWRYRLLTLFKIAMFWGVILAAITISVMFTIYASIPLMLAYAFVWSFRRKGLPE